MHESRGRSRGVEGEEFSFLRRTGYGELLIAAAIDFPSCRKSKLQETMQETILRNLRDCRIAGLQDCRIAGCEKSMREIDWRM